MNTPRIPARGLLAALSVAAVLAPAAPASAVGTRSFQLSSIEDFKGGDITAVSVDSNGNVRAGLNLGAIPIPDAATVWSAALLPGGSVMLGTGSDGKIFRVIQGKAELAATTEQMAVSALVVGWDGDVFAGTLPDGKIFKVKPGQNGGAAETFVTLQGVEDIWSLAHDARAKALYAATGPKGELYRIDQSGKAQVYYKSEDPHVVSVAVAPDGTVYAGSNGKALFYKITGPGRGVVLHDFDADDVRSIAVAPNGSVFVIANKYNEPFVSPKRNKPGPPSPTCRRWCRRGRTSWSCARMTRPATR